MEKHRYINILQLKIIIRNEWVEATSDCGETALKFAVSVVNNMQTELVWWSTEVQECVEGGN